jgi:outer membrane protein assembly factor BamD (BamD/ComL family)
MKKICFLLSITLFTFLHSFSQFKYLKQAKEAINDKKYDLALEKIETYQKKEGINTGYYYLKFLLNNAIDNDFDKVDTAYFYLTVSNNEFSKLPLKEKEHICKELDFCEVNNALIYSNFENKVYHTYCDNKSEENINLFLDKYPYNLNYAVAEKLRDSIEFERAAANSSPVEITTFLTKRPNSHYHDKAIIALHIIEFKITKKTNTIEAFEAFIESYPKAVQVKEALEICQELAYTKSIEENSETAYENYLSKYPNSPKKADVENRLIDIIWSRIKNNASTNALLEFIKKFPKSEFVEVAKEKIELLSWEKATQENSESAFEAFMVSYPKSKNINEAKARIQNIKSTVLPYLTTEKKYKLYNLAKQSFVNDEVYDEMYLQKNGLIIISNYKKYGVIDCSGNAIIPATYDCISSTSNAFIVSLGDKYGVIDLKGTKILPIAFDNISLYYDSLYSVQIKKNDTTYDNSGLYDLAGNKIFDCNYTSIQKANNNLFILNSPTGYFIATKQGAISKKYSSLTYLKDDLFVFELLKKQGVVNAEGKIIIPATYKYIRKLDDDYLTIANATDREGIVDYSGNVILTPNYYNIQKISSALLLLDLRKKYDDPIVNYKLYNVNKKEYYNGLSFDQMLDIQEGFIAFSKNDKLGYMDSLGNIKVQPIFSSEILGGPGLGGPGDGEGFEEGYEKCYSVNENLNYNEFEFFNEYNLSPNFSSGLATVQIGNQYGYINRSGDITIPIIYDMAYSFHDQTSIVAFKTIDEKFNYNIIDQSGRKLVENITPVVYYDQQHFLMYKSAGNYYKINTINHEIDNLNISDNFEIIYLFKNNYYSIYKGCDVYIKKEGGIVLMDRNIDFSEYDLNIKLQKGESLFYQQQYSECFDVFETIIQINPNHYEANLWLGKTYVAQQNYYAAKAQFERCLEINPSNIEPLTERKEMNYEQKNWREFTEDMEKLKLRNEYTFSANDYFRCGYAYVQIYNSEEALSNYNLAIY